MDKQNKEQILSSMESFIQQKGMAEVNKIESEMDKEFSVMKAKYVEEEEKRIADNYKASLSNQTVKLKIEKSKQQNMARIERMRKVNEYVDQLRQ